MDQRQKNILYALIDQYIHTGGAVGSRAIYEGYDLGVSPALIRAEMHDLMEQGYLVQPHTSGGRIPTDSAFRLYVDAMQEELARQQRINKSLMRLCNELISVSLPEMISSVSRHAQALGVGYEFDPPKVYKSGLDQLVEGIDLEDRERVLGIVQDFENLDKHIEDVAEMEGAEQPLVYIGSESPLTASDSLSLIMQQYDLPDGQRTTIVVVGTKCMDYKKNISLLQALKRVLRS